LEQLTFNKLQIHSYFPLLKSKSVKVINDYKTGQRKDLSLGQAEDRGKLRKDREF